jgi:hypothetical protein
MAQNEIAEKQITNISPYNGHGDDLRFRADFVRRPTTHDQTQTGYGLGASLSVPRWEREGRF